MSNPLVTRSAVQTAVKHLLVFGDTDLYPPAIELRFLADNLDRLVPSLTEIEKSAMSRTTMSHPGIARDAFYSRDLCPRIATQLPILLAIFSTIHAFSLVNRFDSLWGYTLNDAVFSYRPNLSQPGELFDRNIGWKDFVKKQEELAEDFPWKISIDLAQFYASVRDHHIEGLGTHLPLAGEDKIFMRFFFQSARGSVYGLPVGGDYSRVIGELILSEFDKYALDRGWRYCRFVDDMRIFFSSEDDARLAIYRLIDFFSQLGFQINQAKFQLEQNLKVLTRTVNRTLGKSKEGGPKCTDSFFDPYSELVITRVDELKQVSAAEDLKQLIELELEKIVPDIRSLKIYISALHYSSESEVGICYPLLVKQATNVHYFSILPKLVRLTIAMKSAMDPKLVNILTKQLIMDLVGSYRKLPDSVVGQICRIISELSETLDPSSSNFFFGLLREQSGSIFVKREIINLVRLRSEVGHIEVLKMIENEPVLMSAWDPSSLLK
tara:strand:- start:158 stop:1639 length:1482 start_codon:yes stop_codon:yes gene_type:complete